MTQHLSPMGNNRIGMHSSNITPDAIKIIHGQISDEIWDDPDMPVSLLNDEEKAQKLSKKTMNFLDSYVEVEQPKEKRNAKS